MYIGTRSKKERQTFFSIVKLINEFQIIGEDSKTSRAKQRPR